MTDLGLADAVDTTETLLQPVGVPGQVIVDHQVGALQVDTLSGRIRGEQDLHLGVVLEGLLGLHPLFAANAAVDDDHRGFAPEQGGDPGLQVVERVPVLGEQDQFLVGRRLGRRDRPGAVGNVGLACAEGTGSGKNGVEQAGQFLPLGIGALAPHLLRQPFEPAEGIDFRLEFHQGARSGRLVEELLLGGLDFCLRRVLQVFHVLLVEDRQQGGRQDVGRAATLEHLHLPQAALQSFPPTMQGLVDGLGRRGQPALEDGQGEADRAGPLVVLQGLGPVELFTDVFRHRLVECGLVIRKPVRHGVGNALGKKRGAVELEQVLLDHAPHQVGHVR